MNNSKTLQDLKNSGIKITWGSFPRLNKQDIARFKQNP